MKSAPEMKRRSFLQVLLGAPAAFALPAAKPPAPPLPAPVVAAPVEVGLTIVGSGFTVVSSRSLPTKSWDAIYKEVK